MSIHNIHCGACLEKFDTADELSTHLDTCPVAKVLLPFIYIVSFGGDAIGHPVSHFIQLSHKHAHIIKRYAHAIADEMPSMERAKLHLKLCEDMGIVYENFRPFESNEITKMPTRDEAEEILWYALVEYFDLNGKLEESRKIRK